MSSALAGALQPLLVDGQRQLARATRAFLHATDPELLEFLIDAADDAIFLEPMLFAYIRAGAAAAAAVELPQLLVGYMAAASRPETIDIRTDHQGRAYLPRLGCFVTDLPDAVLRLGDLAAAAPADLRLSTKDGAPVAHWFEPVAVVPGTRVELYRHDHPLLAIALGGRRGKDRVALEVAPTLAEAASLGRALAQVRAHHPALARDLGASLRAVCLFRGADLASCAAIAVHGVVFVNLGDEPCDEVKFLDELAHQGGHVVLNAITAEDRGFFAIPDPDRPVAALADAADDTRSVYTWLHGLYTELQMIDVLTAALARGDASARQAHELRGRLADITRKLELDAVILPADLLRGDGRAIHAAAVAAQARARTRHPELATFDLSSQPYTFSYRRFAELNPPPVTSREPAP